MSKELNELIKELGKIVDGNQSIVEELDKLKSLYEKLKLEVEEKLEYPFEDKEEYFCLNINGEIIRNLWSGGPFDEGVYTQGHVFKNREEVRKERDKRALLTRFRQFRDKCNGDWKPFECDHQFYLSFDTMTNVIHINCVYINKSFALFGYFKNKSDAERAIELFGYEIKRLWVDE